MPHPPAPAVTVLGLGAMGSALAAATLAAATLAAGHPTTVWNRTPGHAEALAAAGARAPTVREPVVAGGAS